MTDYLFSNAEEERRKKKAELSDFRRNHQSSLNYLRSTMEAVIPSLLEDGMGEKELDIFIEQVKERSKQEAKSESVDSEMERLLKKLIRIHEAKEQSDSERERQLAQKCLELTEWYLRPKNLDAEQLKSEPKEAAEQ